MFAITSLLLLIIARSTFFAEASSKTKALSTIEEIHQYIKNTDILIPSYRMDEKNPYLHTAIEVVSLQKSEQYDQWDGYNIEIIPTKLSKSLFFHIIITSSKSNDVSNNIVKWKVTNANNDFLTSENYPKGEYTRVLGILFHGNYQYEILGYAYGIVNEMSEQNLINELNYLLNSMKGSK